MEESNRSHSPMFYSLLLRCTAMFSLILLLFSENILESSPCQSVPTPSPSAGLVIGGWSDGPQRTEALLGFQACLWGTLSRQSHQTASSGYCMTHNSHHGPSFTGRTFCSGKSYKIGKTVMTWTVFFFFLLRYLFLDVNCQLKYILCCLRGKICVRSYSFPLQSDKFNSIQFWFTSGQFSLHFGTSWVCYFSQSSLGLSHTHIVLTRIFWWASDFFFLIWIALSVKDLLFLS